MLITTVQLHVEETTNSQLVMHTSMSNTDISLAREFKKHISYSTRAHDYIDHVNYRK